MAAPVGNTNAQKGALWRNAINRALEERTKKRGLDALQDLADKFLAACEAGDITALKELGDRLDGKPTQPIAGDLDITVVIRKFTDAAGN